jgi:hypothetical protein
VSLDTETDGIAVIAANDLAQSVAEWAHLEPSEVSSAINQLTMQATPPEQHKRYWEVERKAERILTRPFVSTKNDMLLIAPQVVRLTQRLFGESLFDGQIPWPKELLGQPLLDRLANHRDSESRSLERLATATVKSLGYNYVPNLLEHIAAKSGLGIPGEIDLLFIDDEGTVWVCEVKDLGRVLGPTAIKNRVDAFTRTKRGYTNKLEAKAEAIRQQPNETLLAIGTTQTVVRQVRSVFITKNVEPTAHSANQRIPFVVIDDFAAFITERR